MLTGLWYALDPMRVISSGGVPGATDAHERAADRR